MIKSKRAMRRTILGKLYEVLQEQGSVAVTRESFLEGQFMHHELDALLAFKSDTQMLELRRALERLEDGTLDVCISCKGRIPQAVLDTDPTRRICDRCEKELSHVVTRSIHVPMPV